jgi:hypothetical protein
VKAKIWKDRETGLWCYDLQMNGLRSTGEVVEWTTAFNSVITDMRWMAQFG